MSMSASVWPTESKPQASAGNRTQAEMPFIGEVNGPQHMPPQIVAKATFNGCLNEAVRHSGMDDQHIADAIHISHGYMSRFMRGVGQQQAKRLVAFMRVTQSLAPLQWMGEQMGCDVTPRASVVAELAATRARLAELERATRGFA